MFKNELLNKLAVWVAVASLAMCGLTALWNWVMPVLGIAKLTVWQFTALFVVAHSLTIELVSFKKPKKDVEQVPEQ